MIKPDSSDNVSQNKLLKMHIEALFMLDAQSKLVTINEPWDGTKAVPRLYLGKTFDGSMIYKFRYDTPLEIIKILEKYLQKEAQLNKWNEIKYINEYLGIFGSNNYFDEICYYYEAIINEKEDNCIKITAENIKNYRLNEFDWLNDEIKYSQPCYGIIEDNQIISICRSVRITEKAHEAGIETIERCRGKGYAEIVLKSWVKTIQNKGCIALYSTNKGNKSSQRVAEKASINKFGIGISIK
jgi:hypothetical protein